MKLLLLCLAIPLIGAVAIDILILIVYQQGMLDVLVRAGLGGLIVRLSGRPP